MNDPVGTQWAIGRALELWRDDKINQADIEANARDLLAMRDRIDGASPQTSSATNAPRRSESAPNGQEKRTGFIPRREGKKMGQQDLFRKLAKAANMGPDDLNVVVEFLDTTASGGRGGEISAAIDDLQSANKEDAAQRLVKVARAWQTQQSSFPADETGLPSLEEATR